MDILTNFENYLLGQGLSPGTADIFSPLAPLFRLDERDYGDFEPAAITPLM